MKTGRFEVVVALHNTSAIFLQHDLPAHLVVVSSRRNALYNVSTFATCAC